jgi:hypothetical protein
MLRSRRDSFRCSPPTVTGCIDDIVISWDLEPFLGMQDDEAAFGLCNHAYGKGNFRRRATCQDWYDDATLRSLTSSKDKLYISL